MKKFRKKFVSVAISTGISFGGVATCNFCINTKCSAIDPKIIAKLVEDDKQLKQLVEEIRQQKFYKDFVEGKSKSKSKSLLIKEVQSTRDMLNDILSKAKKARADADKAKADLEKANADLEKAKANEDKANADLKKAYINVPISFSDFDKSEADLGKATVNKDKAKDDFEMARFNEMFAALHLAKAKANADKAYINWCNATNAAVKMIVSCMREKTDLEQSNFCKNIVTQLELFVAEYNFPCQLKSDWTFVLDFIEYLLETDPSLE